MAYGLLISSNWVLLHELLFKLVLICVTIKSFGSCWVSVGFVSLNIIVSMTSKHVGHAFVIPFASIFLFKILIRILIVMQKQMFTPHQFFSILVSTAFPDFSYCHIELKPIIPPKALILE